MEKYIIIFSLIVGLILLLILVISIVKNNSKKAKEEYKNWGYYLFDNLEGKIVKNVQNNN